MIEELREKKGIVIIRQAHILIIAYTKRMECVVYAY